MAFEQPLFPANLVVAGRRCLVVGGGAVAAQKAKGLVECGADVRVVAPALGDEMRDLVAGGMGVSWDERPYREGDVVGHRLVMAATDDAEVNHQVFLDAERHDIWVNSADDPANCTFTLPSRVRQGALLVTFSTGGASPAVATWLRRRFEGELGPEYSTLVELLAEARQQVRSSGRSTEEVDWQRALDSGMLDLIREGRLAEAKERLQGCL